MHFESLGNLRKGKNSSMFVYSNCYTEVTALALPNARPAADTQWFVLIQRETKTETETETDRQTERQTDRQRGIGRETETQQRDRESEREKERDYQYY